MPPFPSPAPPVRGEILTCFTSAIATYLAHAGVDYLLAFGLQLYLATALTEDQAGPRGTFLYLHRPLTGHAPLFTLRLERRWEADRLSARARMLQEWQRQGQLIVVGDAFFLPWQVNYRRKHAAHWFTLAEIDEAQQRVRVRDAFAFVDVHGTQAPCDDWLPLAGLMDLAQTEHEPSETYLARERAGLGALEQVPLQAYRGCQWFELTEPVQIRQPSRALCLEELHETYRQLSGTARRADLPEQEWKTGLAAVADLPRLFRQYLQHPGLYAMRDDLWAAARHHQVFFQALRHLAGWLDQSALHDLARWGDEVLVPRWFALPRVMLYNGSRLLSAGAPRALLIQLAEEVVRGEEECLQRLATCLAGVGGQFFPGGTPGDRAPEQTRSRRPCNPVEQRVAEVWTLVLEIEEPGCDEDFFRLGGDSLQATQIASRLSLIFQVEISLLTLLERPSIAELALAIEELLFARLAETSGEGSVGG